VQRAAGLRELMLSRDYQRMARWTAARRARTCALAIASPPGANKKSGPRAAFWEISNFVLLAEVGGEAGAANSPVNLTSRKGWGQDVGFASQTTGATRDGSSGDDTSGR
jgi:hypothetical protein